MGTLLHLDAGANDSGESVTRELSALFAREWRKASLEGEQGYGYGHGYVYRDLVAEPVPLIDGAYCAFGRRVERGGGLPEGGVAALVADEEEARVWEVTRPYVDELLAADTVVIGAPLYNYSVSAHLKAWMDRVAFPGAFEAPGTGARLLRGTRVVVAGARGGDPADGRDFQTPALRAWFGRLGVAPDDLHFVQAGMTLAGLVPHLADWRPRAAHSYATAREQVAALGCVG
ncbi:MULTISPECIES: FMN-dependent NADH-azoreductase [unclassified Streptomyces]|uniref:FMN-dependent NADH-azoreductase n=1 Tax=unclassified Streptomyces TaxID=2593676 RepID=UPI00278C492C|nr:MULTISPECIES: NAD(P)H-dependent oxidoreductase [unclassified Streptomyces]